MDTICSFETSPNFYPTARSYNPKKPVSIVALVRVSTPTGHRKIEVCYIMGGGGSGVCVQICKLRLVSCNRGYLQKLPVEQLLKKLPAFHGVRKFITTFTRALYFPHPESEQSNILTLSTKLLLGLSSCLFPSLTNNLYVFLLSPFVLHSIPISFLLTWTRYEAPRYAVSYTLPNFILIRYKYSPL
jgi:hypothetical protein